MPMSKRVFLSTFKIAGIGLGMFCKKNNFQFRSSDNSDMKSATYREENLAEGENPKKVGNFFFQFLE